MKVKVKSSSRPKYHAGYYKQPEQTAAVFKELNGKTYFRTGDIGTFVNGPNGKNILKLQIGKRVAQNFRGKYVAPAPIESLLKEEFLIEQAMVVGDSKKFVSALIVPSVDALKNWCDEHHVAWTSLDEVVKNEGVISRYQHAIDLVNENFSHIEKIKKFTILAASWDASKVDGSEAELTPTMKLKRRVILQKYSEEIGALYA